MTKTYVMLGMKLDEDRVMIDAGKYYPEMHNQARRYMHRLTACYGEPPADSKISVKDFVTQDGYTWCEAIYEYDDENPSHSDYLVTIERGPIATYLTKREERL